MANITISIDEILLKKGREYARKHQISLNRLIRKLLSQTVESDRLIWLDECFEIMDKAKGNSRGQVWNREDLYNE